MSRYILIAVDGSSASDYAFRWATDNFFQETDTVGILYVASPASQQAMYFFDSPDYGGVAFTPDLVEALQQEQEEKNNRIRKHYSEMAESSGLNFEVIEAQGEPREEISKQIALRSAHSLVIASRGHGAVARLFMGSVSSYCATHCAIPVVIVKEPQSPTVPAEAKSKDQ